MNYAEFRQKYSVRLNAQQEAAVRAVDGNVLLLAVPGSGKTTVLVTRLGYMRLCLGIDAENILAMTYTVAAARDMKKRFASIFGDEAARGLEFRTINSFAADVIRHYSRHTGSKAFELLSDEKESAVYLADIYRKVSGEFAGDSDVAALRTAISYAKNMRLKENELKDMDKKLKGFSEMFEAYKKFMVQRGLMDFDDQLVYAHSILRRYPEILEWYRRRYPYICVDEAQDTSLLQHEIIDLVSKGGNLFMVGDEDQSIYGFRAAYPKALLDFEKTHPGAKVLLMEENFRSDANIVRAADRFIALNSSRREKNMRAQRGGEVPVKQIQLESRSAQYDRILEVAQNCERETAVLYRDNDCVLPLIDLLQRCGIGYRCRQLDSGFFTNRVLRDVTDIINFARDQSDGYIFMRIYYKMGAGINKLQAEAALKSCGDGQSLLDAVAESPLCPVWQKKKCRSLMQDMDRLHSETAENAIYRIFNYMGYLEYLDRTGADTKRCDILLSLARNENSLDAFLRRMDELHELAKQGTTDPDSKLMLSTVHSSKGLEYDRVYLMDVIDGILPCDIREDDADAEERLEEERRLFYVAVTRAKNELNIFTFRRRDISSEFSSAVFGSPVKKAAAAPSAIKAPAAQKNSLEYAKKDFFAGVRIKHRSFGKGTILARQDDILHICFDSGEQRKLLLETALKLNLINIEK